VVLSHPCSRYCGFLGTRRGASGAVRRADNDRKYLIGAGIFLVGLVFVYRSFYRMRIPEDPANDAAVTSELPA
jgi:hypothetical protein